MDIKEINVNGYDTFFSEGQDEHGLFLAIAIPSAAYKDISDICGQMIDGHMIKEVGYYNTDGTKFIKAYY